MGPILMPAEHCCVGLLKGPSTTKRGCLAMLMRLCTLMGRSGPQCIKVRTISLTSFNSHLCLVPGFFGWGVHKAYFAQNAVGKTGCE
jgi:hypothetical protein